MSFCELPFNSIHFKLLSCSFRGQFNRERNVRWCSTKCKKVFTWTNAGLSPRGLVFVSCVKHRPILTNIHKLVHLWLEYTSSLTEHHPHFHHHHTLSLVNCLAARSLATLLNTHHSLHSKHRQKKKAVHQCSRTLSSLPWWSFTMPPAANPCLRSITI